MNHSNINKKLSLPFYQAAFSLVSLAVIMLIAKLLSVSPKLYWQIAAALLLLFVVMNTVFSLMAKESMKYWRDSVYSFIGLVVLSGGCAYWASSLSIHEAGSYYFIYKVIIISYLVFSSIANVLKKIGEYADNEDWEPRRPKSDE